MKVSFSNPLFLILIPVGIILLILSVRFIRTRAKDQKIKQVILRSIIWTLLCLALSGTSLSEHTPETATVFLVDASDSVSDKKDEIINFITESVKTKSTDDYVGIVAFGKDANVNNFLSKECDFNGITVNVDKSGTNIESAVSLALNLMPDSAAKRIVIISDGAETNGNLKEMQQSVIDADCEIKTYTLSPFQSPEIYVTNVTVPSDVGIGETFKVTVEVESNVNTTARISLYHGRTLTAEKQVTLSKGTSIIPFFDTQTEAGIKTYRVKIDSENDTYSLNNEYSAYTNITKKAPVLLIADDLKNVESFKKMLTDMSFDVNVIVPASAPDTISSMLEYSCIILSDVYAADLPDGFMNNIEAYVRDYGKGLIACGGRNSFGLGEYTGTALETVLPVNSEIKGEAELPITAIEYVIDVSGSMSDTDITGVSKLAAAKSALSESLTTLRSIDYVGVIAFDDSFSKIVPLKKIGSSLSDIRKTVSGITGGGGTSIYPAVEAAVKDLTKCDATIKHIILLTDGQDTYANYSSLLNEINNNTITLSAIAIGNDSNVTLLNTLSSSAGGRVYTVTNLTDLPKIFTQEIQLTANYYLVDEESKTYITASDDLINDCISDGVPSIKAYIRTTAKSRATVLFETENEDPLLSCMQYGLGKTIAWASDITGNWSGNFFAWENNALLWNNLIQFVTTDNSEKDSYASVTTKDDTATISYTTSDYSASTQVEAVITSDSGAQSTVTLYERRPGEFEAETTLSSEGVYMVAIKKYEGDELISGLTTAAIKKYSSEYTLNRTSTLLSDFALLTSGTEITLPSQVFTKSTKSVKAMFDITTELCLVALFFFILDIAYRRFGFRIVPEGFWKRIFDFNKQKNTLRVNQNTCEKVTSKSSEALTAKTGFDTANITENSATNNAAGSTAHKNLKDKKNKTPDVLDTSALLNRMKKQ